MNENLYVTVTIYKYLTYILYLVEEILFEAPFIYSLLLLEEGNKFGMTFIVFMLLSPSSPFYYYLA